MAETPRVPNDLKARKQRFQQIVAALEGKRTSWDSRIRDIAEYQAPTRVQFWNDESRGRSQNSKIIDSTASDCGLVLESGLLGGGPSPARPWKRLTVADPMLAESGNVKEWCHEVDRNMDAVFSLSNFYSEIATVLGDGGFFATGCAIIDEDEDTVIRTHAFPFGSYWLGLNAKRQPRVFARKSWFTTRQVVERFGEDKVGRTIRDQFRRQEYEEKHEVTHLILPNDQFDGTKLESKYKKFLCVYFLSSNEEPYFLLETGYDEWPVLAFRWAVHGEDPYGTDSPGMTAQGDVKALQLGEKRKAQAIDKVVNPPMVAQPGMRNSALSGLPGTVSYVTDPDGKGFRPLYQIQPDIGALEQMLEQIRTRIRRAFRTDLFLMLAYSDKTRGQQPVTAREIEAREQEKMLVLGSLLLRLNEDVLDVAIDRVFGIMMRRGLVPEPPEELQGVKLQVKYISVMHQAQEMVGVGAVQQAADFVLSIFERTENPDVLDIFDFDQAAQEMGGMLGVPPSLIRSDDKVEEMRAGRAKAQKMAQEAQLLKDASAAAKNLATSPTGEGRNALTDLVGSAA